MALTIWEEEILTNTFEPFSCASHHLGSLTYITQSWQWPCREGSLIGMRKPSLQGLGWWGWPRDLSLLHQEPSSRGERMTAPAAQCPDVSLLSHRGCVPPCTASTSFTRLRFTRLRGSLMGATSPSRTSMSFSLAQCTPMTWGNTWRALPWW